MPAKGKDLVGKFSRDKGAREERAIVNCWRGVGFSAERVPLSGASGGSFAGDIQIKIEGEIRVFEAKLRSKGFSQIYDWLRDHYGLFIRADNRDRLVVMRETDFQELLNGRSND
jgi:hypothetical protein